MKQSKTIKQLQAIYDIKGPIKGRVRKRALRKNRKLRVLGGEEQQESSSLTKSEESSQDSRKQKEVSEPERKTTIEDDIRELERELAEARKIAAKGRVNLPGGGPSDGANGGRRPKGGESEGGNTEGIREGSSSRFPRRGYPK